MTLDILIATTIDRRYMFTELHMELTRQIEMSGLRSRVHIIPYEDNKEISVGKKRQMLLEKSKSKYIVYFDSDDFPRSIYVTSIIQALKVEPDCIGFKIGMTTNGKNPETCIHSLSNKTWFSNLKNKTHYRSVTHFNPVKRQLALQVGFKDMRYGEDRDYSDRLTPLCKNEYFIDEFLFDYRYSNTIPHKQKYGIQ